VTFIAAEGRIADAVAVMRADQNRVPYSEAVLAYFLARNGQREEALRILESLLDHQRNRNGNAYPVAVAYTGLRDFDAALHWLDLAIEDRSAKESIMEPLFAELRLQPGFRRLAQRLGIQDYD